MEPEIARFIQARLDVLEAQCDAILTPPPGVWDKSAVADRLREMAAEVLAVAESDRRIVQLCMEAISFEGPHHYSPSCAELAEDVLRAKAARCSDHPEYRAEWAPA